MRKSEFASLAHEIRSLTGVSTKLMMQDLETLLAEHHPSLSVPQFYVLRILEHHPSTIRELSDRMMLAPSTLVPIVDKLEKEGLLLRGKDPEDRRRTPLELTTQARHVLVNVPDIHMHDRLFDALQAMGPDKCRELSKLLQELVNELDPDHTIVEHILAFSSRVGERAAHCEAKAASSHHQTR